MSTLTRTYAKPASNKLVEIDSYEDFIATVEALRALYPTITKTVAQTSGQQLFTDIVMTKDLNGQTLTDIYGKQVATDIVSAMIRHIAYGYYLSRPVLVVGA
jgi:translation elongation factor EF-Ts